MADAVRLLADDYKTKGKGELPVDRIVYGYLIGKYGSTARQHPIRSEGKERRIDFLIGTPELGTFVELVVRRHGQEWQCSQNGSELNKLVRANGRVRALVIVDVSAYASINHHQMRADYAGWKSTPGKFERKHITIVYSGAAATYSFGLKTGKKGVTLDN